ncbi:MAG: DUF4956 domain-containing protein [Bacilli bacterium]|nr:DUF4956 domain-containing protein [Bacilli bacterium]
MFSSILTSNLSITNFMICIFAALILGVISALVHKMTSDKNSQNFINTLAILPALVTTVIIMVNGNLGTSIAVAGTFTLVRFRSIPGNSKEILSVFFAMAIGLAVGSGYIFYAICFTLMISLVLFLFSKLRFGSTTNDTKILKIVVPEDLDYAEDFKEVFERFTTDATLIQTKTIDMGSLFELTYKVKEKKGMKEKEFIDAIRERNANLKVVLTHRMMEMEL